MEILKDKIFLASAFGVVLLGIFISKKNNSSTELTLKGYDTEARNGTVYIPTSETHIDYVAGNQTITNSDSRSSSTVGDNSTVSLPAIATPQLVSPSKKYVQISKTSSIFETISSEYSTGTITPQRVEVLQENPSGWLKIKSWKGDVWVKDGYVRPAKSLFTTKKVGKSDTLWSLTGGDKDKINAVAKLNGISDINKIQAGSILKLPV
jgi:hypothetical protein